MTYEIVLAVRKDDISIDSVRSHGGCCTGLQMSGASKMPLSVLLSTRQMFVIIRFPLYLARESLGTCNIPWTYFCLRLQQQMHVRHTSAVRTTASIAPAVNTVMITYSSVNLKLVVFVLTVGLCCCSICISSELIVSGFSRILFRRLG